MFNKHTVHTVIAGIAFITSIAAAATAAGAGPLANSPAPPTEMVPPIEATQGPGDPSIIPLPTDGDGNPPIGATVFVDRVTYEIVDADTVDVSGLGRIPVVDSRFSLLDSGLSLSEIDRRLGTELMSIIEVVDLDGLLDG